MGALSLLAASSHAGEEWTPPLEFGEHDSGNLDLRKHPLSPASCGIEIVEVGIKDPVTTNFEPHMALLRDTYDSSYPGIAPKVRRIYSYNMPVPLKDPEKRPAYLKTKMRTMPSMPLPPVIVDTDDIKAHIVRKMLFMLTRTVITSMGNPVASGAVLAVDQFVDVYLRKRAYHRARSLYMLRLLAEHKRGIYSYFNPGELERLIAVGDETEYKGLLITKDYEDFVYTAQNDALREKRVKNYANLLSALNREGLIAQPLIRDFVAVYYDPKKEYGRKIDLTYTDLEVSPETATLRENSIATKSGLIPLGIFAIGDSVDRLLQYDALQPDRVRNRKWIQYFTRLARNVGTAFLPFPLSLTLRGSKMGVEFILNKEGVNILTDTLKTEGELLALIDSGIVSLDPAFVAQVRNEMDSAGNEALNSNVLSLLATDDEAISKIHKYRAKSMANMERYLGKRSKFLCQEIAALREGEFRSEYLTAGESWGRRFQAFFKFFGFSSDHEFAEERKEIILNRTELIEARRTLINFNPYIGFTSNDRIVMALDVVAEAKDPEDTSLFTELMEKFVDPDLLSATIKAATIHGNGKLIDPIADYLLKFDPNKYEVYPYAVSHGITALTRLDILSADDPEETVKHAIQAVEKLSRAKSEAVRSLAVDAFFRLTETKLKLMKM